MDVERRISQTRAAHHIRGVQRRLPLVRVEAKLRLCLIPILRRFAPD